MVKIAAQAGISYSDLCAMDFKEFNAILDGYVEKSKNDQEERLALAYKTAEWVRCKQMPALKNVLDDIKQTEKQPKKGEKMSDKAMLNTVKALNAALGGTIY